MAKDTITLPEFIHAYQGGLEQRGTVSLNTPIDERVGAFSAPAATASTYDESKSYPWIPEFTAVTENIMAIVSKPRTHLKVYKEVKQAEKAVRIANDDVIMTLKVPRFWKEKDNRMLPEYIYSDTSETDYAIYENRFVVALIDKMRSFISHSLAELYSQPKFLSRYVADAKIDPLDLSFLQKETPDALNPIMNASELLTDKDDPIIATLRKLLDAQRILSHSVSTPFYKEVKKAKALSDSDIHATNMLIGDRNYAACFQFYMKLLNYSTEQHKKDELIQSGYCNWALERLFEVYKKLGFKLSSDYIPLNANGYINVDAITATRGSLKAEFKRDSATQVSIIYTVSDTRLVHLPTGSRKRRSRVCLDFMPGLTDQIPTVDDLDTEINHLVFHRMTPEQDYENAFVLTAEPLVSERGAVIANPNISKIDANLENMVRSCLTFLRGDAWTYSRICPICGAYMDGENEDGNFYCPNCDSVYAFVEIGSDESRNEMIWVKRLHSPTGSDSKKETLILNVLRTTAEVETERLLLRTFDGDDLNALFEITKKSGPLEMMGERHPLDLDACQLLLDRFMNRDYRAIIRQEDNALIGVIGLEEKMLDGYRRFSHRKIEVFIGPDYWGRGYATEAMVGMVDHAFNALHLDLVWAQSGDFNLAAIKVLHNAGFSFIDKVEDTYDKDIVEASELHRFVKFNPNPTMLGSSGGFMNTPTPIRVPELYNDVLVEGITEEDYQQELLHDEERLKQEAIRKAEEERLEAEKRKILEEEAAIQDAKNRVDSARLAAKHLVEKGLPEPEIITEPCEEEEEDMPKPDPINLEITEDQTVIMEIDGVQHVLYEGKAPAPQPAPKPVKKVAPKPAPKSAPKPAPKPEPKPEPKQEVIVAKKVEEPAPAPKRPIISRPRNTERLDPTRELAAFGPGTSDDSLHSIHTVSFEEKIEASDKDIKEKYDGLSKYLIDTYGCAHRVSFGYDAYRVGKKTVAAISIGGVHLRLNTAIDPKVYAGTRMMVNDDTGSKKYKDLPAYIKVISDKSYKQAFRLIDDTMKSLSIKKKKA